MLALKWRLDLATLARIATIVAAISVSLAAGSIVFILAWARRHLYQGVELSFLKYVLVQTHLATENVVASWFSSMLLLSVSVAALVAWVQPPAARTSPAPRWLRHGWLIVAGVFALLSLDELASLHERVGMVVSFRGRGVGWVYVLALPILVTAAYLVAFAWYFLRPLPLAFGLFVAGVGLFALNPVVEQIEMALIHGPGAQTGTWARFAHDTLLVFEEGLLELFGTLCFLMAVLVWLRARAVAAGREDLTLSISPEGAARPAAFATLAILAGTPLLSFAVRLMPAADTGIPANWFPAAAAFLLFLLTLAARAALPDGAAPLRRLAKGLAGAALAISAYFGAGIHGYTDWGAFDVLRELLRTTLSLAFALVCIVLARTRRGEYIGAMFLAAVLMAYAINVSGAHAPPMAAVAAIACVIGLTLALAPPVPRPDSPPAAAPPIKSESIVV